MFTQKSFLAGWTCDGCKTTNSQFITECKNCKSSKPTTPSKFGSVSGSWNSGFGGNTIVFGNSQNTPQMSPTKIKPSDTVVSAMFPPAPSAEYSSNQQDLYKSNDICPPQNTTSVTLTPTPTTTNPREPFELRATTNISEMKDDKTMGLLLCSAVAGKCNKIDTVEDSCESFELFKSVIKKDHCKPVGRLTTIAPLSMVKISTSALKDILRKDATDDEIDTCDVYLSLLRSLINKTLTTKDGIINHVISGTENDRLYFTVKFAATNPVDFIKSIKDTKLDVINVFIVALMYFVHFENSPLEALIVAERDNPYFPTEVSKVLAGMIGASYGHKWVPSSWKSISLYQSMLVLTNFFRTVGSSKLV